MKKSKKKFNLWFSKRKAKQGQLFFVPSGDGKKVVKCTAITMDEKPPTKTSLFLSAAYLPIV